MFIHYLVFCLFCINFAVQFGNITTKDDEYEQETDFCSDAVPDGGDG